MLPVAKPLKRMQHGQLGHQFLIPVGQTYPVVYAFEHNLIFLPYSSSLMLSCISIDPSFTIKKNNNTF